MYFCVPWIYINCVMVVNTLTSSNNMQVHV